MVSRGVDGHSYCLKLDRDTTELPRVGSTSRDQRRGAARDDDDDDEHARLVALEREVRELRQADAILKAASAFFAVELDRPLSR